MIVVDLGDGADGGAWVVRGALLVDGDGWREAVDVIDVGLIHLAEELAGVGGERFDVAALALGEDGVEGQAALAAAGEAGDDHQLVARDDDVNIFEVMLAGTTNHNPVLRHRSSLPPRLQGTATDRLQARKYQIKTRLSRARWERLQGGLTLPV